MREPQTDGPRIIYHMVSMIHHTWNGKILFIYLNKYVFLNKDYLGDVHNFQIDLNRGLNSIKYQHEYSETLVLQIYTTTNVKLYI